MTVSLLARLADLISPRACAVCGCRIEVPGHVICAACNIVYGMKYGSHPDFCYQMGRLMAMELMATDFFGDIDVLMPVPLTSKRMVVRGYNQSEEMARGIADITGLPVVTGVVRRTIFKGSQTSLNRWERQDNMEGAWELADGHKVAGKHVAIVDDVVTTGATIMACASQLIKAGNVRISVVCLGYAGKTP